MKRHRYGTTCRGYCVLGICLLLAWLGPGCGGSGSAPAEGTTVHGITSGMSEAEVVEILGKPLQDATHLDIDLRVLEYDEVRVYLEGGKVVSVVEAGDGSAVEE